MQIKIFKETDIKEKEKTRSLYEKCFDEGKNEFVDYYYDTIIKRNIIVALTTDDEIISMVHLNPYIYNVLGNIVKVYYLVAVATKEENRGKGYMKKVLNAAIKYMYDMKVPLCYIVPDTVALEKTYEHFGFERLCKFTVDKFSKDTYDIFPVEDEEYKNLMKMEQYFLEKESKEYIDELSSKIVMFKLINKESFSIKSLEDIKAKKIYVCQEV